MNDNQKEEIFKYIDERIKQLLNHIKRLYDTIDTTHYSPSNFYIFQIINEFTIRIDELHYLKSKLDDGENK